MEKVKVGVVGCGMISDIYLKNMTTVFNDTLEVSCCADKFLEAAAKRGEQYGIRAMTVDELLASDQVDIVLNLTTPQAHYEIEKKALLAGKHVYSEKPVATTVEESRELLALADEKGLKLGCSPDTFLGAGIQTAKKLIQEGRIGKIFSASLFLLQSGPENFHPNPAFLYQEGAGPLLDMGPYWITAAVELMGPVARVAGFGNKVLESRQVKVGPKTGQTFPVEVDSTVAAVLQMRSGAVANLTVSFDMSASYIDQKLPYIQINGTLGSLIVPDPNCFGVNMQGAEQCVYLREGTGEWNPCPLEGEFRDNSRGLGITNMAREILGTGHNYASGQRAAHTLEVMLGILDAVRDRKVIDMETSYGE